MAKSNGGIIGPDNIPSGPLGTASGVWRLQDAFKYQGEGLWPVLTGITYPVANSLRFNDGSSDYLKRTNSSTGNRQKWTFSTWIKRTLTGGNNDMIIYPHGGSSNLLALAFNGTYTLYMDVGGVGRMFETNMLFRDPSAWYHIVVAFNTTDYSTVSAGQVKVYVNGVQQTFLSTTNMSLGFNSAMNDAVDVGIGRDEGADNNYADHYLAETVLIDGQQLTPSSFGETDTVSGNWKPKDVSGLTFGTNGFYLQFQNSGALGTDSSGNGNNFTVNNLTSVDQSTDTPTNNFATGNPLIPSTLTYSDGNLTIQRTTSDWESTGSTLAVTQGKWYAEFKWISGTFTIIGVEDMELVSTWDNQFMGYTANGRGYGWDGDARNNSSTSAFGNSFTTGDIIGVALDMDNKFVYFSKNGTFQNSGDPTSGASGTGGLSLAGTEYVIGCSGYSSTISANFGNPPYAANGYSDANGFGDFSYAVPTGYYALNTQNINVQG